MKRYRTIRNKKHVFRHSVSLRMIEACLGLVLLELAQAVLPSLADYVRIPSVYLLAGASVCGSLAWIGRFLFQRKITGDDDEK